MFQLKRLSAEAIPAALEKAERYRLLNEPGEAESICRDILEVEPENQQALRALFLALTDQFPRHLPTAVNKARAILEYLDFKPIEDLCTRGVLAAATRDR